MWYLQNMGKMKSMLLMLVIMSLFICVSEAVMCFDCGSSDYPVKCGDLASAAACEGLSCITKESDLPDGAQ